MVPFYGKWLVRFRCRAPNYLIRPAGWERFQMGASFSILRRLLFRSLRFVLVFDYILFLCYFVFPKSFSPCIVTFHSA